MKKYSLYLFDFDGTLFNTTESLKEIYRLTFAKYNIVPKEEDYLTFITMSLPRAMKYKGLDMSYEKGFCDFFNANVLDKSVIEKTRLYEDTLDFFKYVFSHNIPIGIVTGSSTMRVRDVFNKYNLDYSKLKTCIGNDCYKIPKPDGEPIIEALKQSGYLNRKNEVVYIGDAEQDRLCAKNAGIEYIQIKRDHNTGSLLTLLDLFK